MATSPGIKRAHARIEPLMVAPATPTMMTAGMTADSAGAMATEGAAGTAADSAGTGAQDMGAAGAGGESAGAAGMAGTGTGAGLAAGSGGDAAPAAAGAGAAGADGADAAAGSSAPEAGSQAEPSGAAGMMAGPTSAGAAGMEAPASITGSASFTTTSSGVNLTVMVGGCQSGKEYPIHVHQGSSCESAMTQGGHWDMTRGEGIPNIQCGGRNGVTMVMRADTDASTAWTVGDGSATDVVGRTVVIHDADDPTVRIACGVIESN